MKVYKCDRCGKTFLPTNIQYPNLGLIAYKKKSKDYSTFIEIDLCSSCIEELNKWLNKPIIWKEDSNV